MNRPFFIITGHGRSGTNLALSLLDTHPRTRCRNEPNKLSGASLSFLDDGLLKPVTDVLKTAPDLLPQACGFSGARDHPMSLDKTCVKRRTAFWLSQGILRHRRVRRALRKALGRASLDEWRYPSFLVEPLASNASAVPVLKILLASTWIAENHFLDPRQHVIHVRREPRGFIQSWWNRYVKSPSRSRPEQVFEESKVGFCNIRDFFDGAPADYADFSMENLIEVELWRWRYVNAVLERRLAGSDRYLQIDYETMMQNRPTATETLFDFAGLSPDAGASTAIVRMKNAMFADAHRWPLEDALLEGCIERVMGGASADAGN